MQKRVLLHGRALCIQDRQHELLRNRRHGGNARKNRRQLPFRSTLSVSQIRAAFSEEMGYIASGDRSVGRKIPVAGSALLSGFDHSCPGPGMAELAPGPSIKYQASREQTVFAGMRHLKARSNFRSRETDCLSEVSPNFSLFCAL
ncbi:hypothetical protein P0082_03030 [Candidatus Haliotispira prima]|uniref:Uncharacterized protein n=1 Tax=Candidatus Haliotispira prima TaxID=3034016 RepID=A0ABY8MJR8_9SPIO|nr:hypothetical protein P0082_03030 [Candidatus Haliotispira prima]